MMPSRRRFVVTAALAAAGQSLGRTPDVRAEGNMPPAPDASAGMSHEMPPHWMGSEQIAFLIYPEFTALDMVGPHYMFTSLMGATVHLVAKTRDPVRSDAGLVFVPSAAFDECPRDLDILCVPGGSRGTLAAMEDPATMRFVRDRGSRARYVTSVCTGSLVLGGAGAPRGVPGDLPLGDEEAAARFRRHARGRARGARPQQDHRRRRHGGDRLRPVAGRPPARHAICAGRPASRRIRAGTSL